MTILLALLGAALGAVLTLALTLVRERTRPAPASWLEQKRRRRLLIHLVDDETIRGVVLEVSAEGLLLGGSEYLGEKSVQMAGEVWIDRARVLFVQSPPPEGPALGD